MMHLAEVLPILLLIMLPLVAIIGGITRGILRANAQQKLVEMAHRERIAALERGLDPASLPPLSLSNESEDTYEQRQLSNSNALLIVGLVLALGGLGLMTLLFVIEPHDPVWPIGLVVSSVGVGFLIGARVVRPSKEELREAETRRHARAGSAFSARVEPEAPGDLTES